MFKYSIFYLKYTKIFTKFLNHLIVVSVQSYQKHGMVNLSETDLTVGGINLFYNKSQDLNWIYPYVFAKVTFITDKERQRPLSISMNLHYLIMPLL